MIDAAYLAAQEAALGYDDFRREFGAEFVAGGASFLEAERLREVVAPIGSSWVSRRAVAGWRRLILVLARDPTALAIVGRDRHDRDGSSWVCGPLVAAEA